LFLFDECFSVSLGGKIVNLIEQVFALLDPVTVFLFRLSLSFRVSINLKIALGVAKAQMSLLDEGRNFFKLVEGISLVMQHDSVENLGQVTVKVLGCGATTVFGFAKLLSDLIKRFNTKAHLNSLPIF